MQNRLRQTAQAIFCKPLIANDMLNQNKALEKTPEPCLFSVSVVRLELWTSRYERLAEVVSGELVEVLDETCCEVLCLLLPLACALVSVAWVEDSRVNAWKLSRNSEIEVRDLLGRSLVDRTVEDCVDDSSCILDRDTLACSVPSCVHEVCLCTYLLHSLDELLTVLGWVE